MALAGRVALRCLQARAPPLPRPPPRGAYTAAVAYATLAGIARFQLINRSTRKPTRLFCQSEVITIVASAGDMGAVSICTLRLARHVDRHAAVVRVQNQIRLERNHE